MTSTGLYLSHTLRDIESSQRALPLMERAGAAAAAWAAELVADRPGPILIFAGPGNNGGDAFIAARLLHQRGFETHVVFAVAPSALPADAGAAYQAFIAAGGKLHAAPPDGPVWRLLIDGIFGIGLNKAPQTPYREWIQTANALRTRDACPLLALDSPSGLNADTGVCMGETIAASHTLTFIVDKPGLHTGDGPDQCGELRIASLDLDSSTLPAADGQLISHCDFQSWLRPRRQNVHKGIVGSAGIGGGATSMTGAAILAARAALKLGTGRVYLGLLDPHCPRLDPLQAELMIRHPAGLLDAKLTALACGPGLGGSLEAAQFLERCLSCELPLVLDADALSLLAQEANLQNILAARQHATVLTPHPGEAASLLDCPIADIQNDRIASACAIARQFHSLVALKGCGSVVATPDGQWWINTSGNPGMATAGMGDVLTGLVVSLLAQGWPAQEALLAAVHLHGASADALVAVGIGPVGLTAGEVIDAARQTFNRWLQHG